MKYTQDQLSKVNWSKFTQGEWSAAPNDRDGDIEIRFASRLYAWLSGDEWHTWSGEFPISEMRKLLAQIDRCDALIASELESPNAPKPPEPGEGFELCEKGEATHWEFVSPDGWVCPCGWSRMSTYCGTSSGTYYFRRPITKPITLAGGAFTEWLKNHPGEHEFNQQDTTKTWIWRWNPATFGTEFRDVTGEWVAFHSPSRSLTLIKSNPPTKPASQLESGTSIAKVTELNREFERITGELTDGMRKLGEFCETIQSAIRKLSGK